MWSFLANILLPHLPALLRPSGTAPLVGIHDRNHWHGWESIENLVIFGDSYTATSFDLFGAQPSRANPLGNPEYPGITSSNGPNWIDFLTTTYNKTFVKTVNLAFAGATIDSGLVVGFPGFVPSVKEQVQDKFLPYYANGPEHFDWRPDNTLFAVFAGINDINNSFDNVNNSVIYPLVFQVYAGLVEQLYHAGARNFLFLNVPPFDRSPGTAYRGGDAPRLQALRIAEWNANVTNLAEDLTSKHRDATSFVFDTHAIYTEVMDDPSSYPETAKYKDVTGFCQDYETGTPSWYTFKKQCGIRVDQYLWLNMLHPTFRIHNVTARAVAEMLSGN